VNALAAHRYTVALVLIALLLFALASVLAAG
jgi:hypothetical protein